MPLSWNERIRRFDEIRAERKLLPGNWTMPSPCGARPFHCLLAAISPECAEKAKVGAMPSRVMPIWVAKIIMSAYDGQGSSDFYDYEEDMIRAFRAALPVFAGMKREDWETVEEWAVARVNAEGVGDTFSSHLKMKANRAYCGDIDRKRGPCMSFFFDILKHLGVEW